MLEHFRLKVPNGFWEAVRQFCRNDLIRKIENQRNVKTGIGKGRSWLFFALNDTELESYLQSFSMNTSEMLKHYHRYALVCSSQICVIQTLISGLDSLSFRLHPDATYLNFQIKPFQVKRSSTRSASSAGSRSSFHSTSSEDSLTEKNFGSVVNIDTATIRHFANDSSKKAVSLVKCLLSGDSLSSNKNVFVPMHVMSDHHDFRDKDEPDPTFIANQCKKCIANNALICLCLDSPKHMGSASNTSDNANNCENFLNMHSPGHLVADMPEMNRDTDCEIALSEVNPSTRSFKEDRINPFDRFRDCSTDSISLGGGSELRLITKRFDQNVEIIDCPIEVIHKSKRKLKSSVSSNNATVPSNHRRKRCIRKMSNKDEALILKADIQVCQDTVFEMGDGACGERANELELAPEVDPGDGDSILCADRTKGSFEENDGETLNLDSSQSRQMDQDTIPLSQTFEVGKSELIENVTLKADNDNITNIQKLSQENCPTTQNCVEECNCGYFIGEELHGSLKEALIKHGDIGVYLSQDIFKVPGVSTPEMTSNQHITEDDSIIQQESTTVQDDGGNISGNTTPVLEISEDHFKVIQSEDEESDEVKANNIEENDSETLNLHSSQSTEMNQDTIPLSQTFKVGKSELIENITQQAYNDNIRNIPKLSHENCPTTQNCVKEYNCSYFIGEELDESLKEAVSENGDIGVYLSQDIFKVPGVSTPEMTSNQHITEDDSIIQQESTPVQDDGGNISRNTTPVLEISEDHFKVIQSEDEESDEVKANIIEENEVPHVKLDTENDRTFEFESISHPAMAEIDNTLRLYLMLEILMDESEKIIKFFKLGTGHCEGDWSPLYLVFTDCFLYFLKSGDGSCPYQIEHIVRYDNLDYVAVKFFAQAMQFVFYEMKTTISKNKEDASRKIRTKVVIDTGDELLTKIIISTLSHSFSAFANQRDVVKVCPSVFYDASEHKIALGKYIHNEGLSGDMQFYQLVHWEDTNSNTGVISANVTLEGLLEYKSSSRWRSNWKRAYFCLSSGMLHQYSTKGAQKPEMCYDLRENNCIGCKRLRTNASSKIFQFEVLFRKDKRLLLQTDSEEVVTDWLQCFCLIVSAEQMKASGIESPANYVHSFSNVNRDVLVPCSLIISQENLLVFHEDQLTGFCRTLAKTSSASIKSVNVDVSTKSVEVTASDTSSDSESHWNIFFSCSQAVDHFNSCVNSFKTAPTFKTTEDDGSRMHFEEARMLLDNRWSRPDNLLRGRDNNEFM